MNLHLDTTHMLDWAQDHQRLLILAPAGAVLALVVAWVILARATRRVRAKLRGADTADQLTIVAAAVATTVTATGMWQVFDDRMPLDIWLRVPVFAFIELATITSAVRARKNSREREDQSAGVDGIAVWAFTALTACLSALDAHSFVEALIRLAAPVVAAWLWERGMNVERARVRGVQRGTIHWRLTPERILVRLGLAEPTARDAGALAAERRLTALAITAARAHLLTHAGARSWRRTWAMRRVQNAMRAAVTHTDLTRDRDQQAHVLGQYNALVHATALTRLDQRPAWLVPALPLPAVSAPEPIDPTSMVSADQTHIADLRAALRRGSDEETGPVSDRPTEGDLTRDEETGPVSDRPTEGDLTRDEETGPVSDRPTEGDLTRDEETGPVSDRPTEGDLTRDEETGPVSDRPTEGDLTRDEETGPVSDRPTEGDLTRDEETGPVSDRPTEGDLTRDEETGPVSDRPTEGDLTRDEETGPVSDRPTEGDLTRPRPSDLDRLREAVASGDLEATASAEDIREQLRIGWGHAKTLRAWMKATGSAATAEQLVSINPAESNHRVSAQNQQ